MDEEAQLQAELLRRNQLQTELNRRGLANNPEFKPYDTGALPAIQHYLTNQGSPARDVAGGALSTPAGLFKGTADFGDAATPPSFDKFRLHPRGQAPAQHFDPYNAVGTTDKPWNTGGGALQAGGSLLGLPGAQAPKMGMNVVDKAAQNPHLLEAITGLLGKAGRGIGDFAKTTYQQIAPDKTAKNVMDKMMGGKTLEEHAQNLASNLKSTYEDVKGGISKKYNELFSKNNLGDKELYPKTNKIGEMWKKGEMGELPGMERKMPDFSNPSAGEEYQDALKAFNKKPTLQNAHELQSEMSSEERMIGKQMNMARKNGQPITQLRKDLKNVKEGRQQLVGKMKDVMGKDAAKEYQDTTNEYLKHVVPYHSDRHLRDIVSGRVTNPKPSEIKNIFSYPENDTKQIVSHLGGNAKGDIVAQGLGIQPSMAEGKQLGTGLKNLSSSGYEHYLSDEDKRLAKVLGDSDLKRYLKLGGKLGAGLAGEEALRRS